MKVDEIGTIFFTTMGGLYSTNGSNATILHDDEMIRFAQINGTHIVMAIPLVHCLKLLDIRTGNATIFAGGYCAGRPFGPKISQKDGVKHDAAFVFPMAIILDIKDANRLLVTDVDLGATEIRSIDIDSANVTTIIHIPFIMGVNIAQQPSTGDIFIVHMLGLLKISYLDLDHSETDVSYESPTPVESFNDLFTRFKGLAFLNDRTVLLTDSSKNVIQALDLIEHTVVSICSGKTEPVSAGNYSHCQLSGPKDIIFVNGTVYVTTNDEATVGIMALTYQPKPPSEYLTTPTSIF